MKSVVGPNAVCSVLIHLRSVGRLKLNDRVALIFAKASISVGSPTKKRRAGSSPRLRPITAEAEENGGRDGGGPWSFDRAHRVLS